MTQHPIERALVIGATGGIGAALVAALHAQGTEIVSLSRSRDGLDLADDSTVAARLGALEPPFDLIFVATGALEIDGAKPERALSQVDASALASQYALNAIGPLLVLKHALRLLPRDRRTVFAALSARVGSIGDNRLGGWYGYRASKAGLNQLLHTAAIEVKRTHPQAVVTALHPGTVATPLGADYRVKHRVIPADEAAANLLGVIDGLTEAETGRFFRLGWKASALVIRARCAPLLGRAGRDAEWR